MSVKTSEDLRQLAKQIYTQSLYTSVLINDLDAMAARLEAHEQIYQMHSALCKVAEAAREYREARNKDDADSAYHEMGDALKALDALEQSSNDSLQPKAGNAALEGKNARKD